MLYCTRDILPGVKRTFPCEEWLGKDIGDGTLERTLYPVPEADKAYKRSEIYCNLMDNEFHPHANMPYWHIALNLLNAYKILKGCFNLLDLCTFIVIKLI